MFGLKHTRPTTEKTQLRNSYKIYKVRFWYCLK